MIEVMLILAVTALATGIIGVFLVLRHLSMTADAISHSVLLGIVLAFFLVPNLDSPALSVGAMVIGLLTVLTVEALVKTGRVQEDAALGIVFPLFFSVGVLLISKFLRNVHLCVDSVIMGEVIMAPMSRTVFLGIDMPTALMRALIVLALNILFIALFYKELKVSTFDPGFCFLSGFSVVLIHYLLMALISLNAVVSFNAVGSILVISLLVTPAATALMLTKNLFSALLWTAFIALFNSIVGTYLAFRLNINVAGTVAFLGMILYLVLRSFKADGWLAVRMKKRQQLDYMNRLLILAHIINHAREEKVIEELGVEKMQSHLGMKNGDYERAVGYLLNHGYVEKTAVYKATESGRAHYLELLKENGL